MIKIDPHAKSSTIYLAIESKRLLSIEITVFDDDGWRNINRYKAKPADQQPSLKDLKHMSRKDALKSVAKLIDQQVLADEVIENMIKIQGSRRNANQNARINFLRANISS